MLQGVAKGPDLFPIDISHSWLKQLRHFWRFKVLLEFRPTGLQGHQLVLD
jgi:hypothetical protein